MIRILKVIHYYWQIFLKVLEKYVQKFVNNTLQNFISAPELARQAALKTTKVELELLTYINRILMIEKGVTGGICFATHSYVKANKKYMKDYD